MNDQYYANGQKVFEQQRNIRQNRGILRGNDMKERNQMERLMTRRDFLGYSAAAAEMNKCVDYFKKCPG